VSSQREVGSSSQGQDRGDAVQYAVDSHVVDGRVVPIKPKRWSYLMLQADLVATTCLRLQELQIRRQFLNQEMTSKSNRITALVVRMIGMSSEADAKEREKTWKRAAKILSGALAKKPPLDDDAPIVREIAPELEVHRLSLEPISARRLEIESGMDGLAANLPAMKFIETVKGATAHGLAVIVGECGDLSRFSTTKKLWRWLGYGMANGHELHAYSTWRRSGGLSKDDWKLARYNPKRQAEIYGVVTVPLFMAKANNKYGAVYSERREWTAVTHPEWTKLHSDMDARRIMTKAFLGDLWKAWASP
jgi:hypothetical protein